MQKCTKKPKGEWKIMEIQLLHINLLIFVTFYGVRIFKSIIFVPIN
jgi:hypothetical protein